jgi:serine/threonine-protein kinase
MSGAPDPPDGPQRTVFQARTPQADLESGAEPGGDAASEAAAESAVDAEAALAPPGPGDMAAPDLADPGPALPDAASSGAAAPQPPDPEPTRWQAKPAAPGQRAASPAPRGSVVTPGVVLNNIYEVKRYLARGGMAEVYEGFNVNSDERVAIKIILPALASDPNVQAMFQKEARNLSRLHHPAVVQYRLLGKEPVLDLFYIVTEFIDGAPLSEMLSELKPSQDDIWQLTRRLAEGLAAAHALNAVHRDMSPDNVLLPDRRLDRAKIIDFGIAKDMDPSKGTIVGDGFAGKLGYVAPEQFGEYDRAVGPWTDVYSLGLVILAVIQGRDVDMGATLVEAVDKRRAGVDLGGVDPEFRGLLARMLASDPAKRLRSMDEVIQALDAMRRKPAPSGRPRAETKATPSKVSEAPGRRPGSTWMIAGGVGAVLLVGGVVALLASRKPEAPAPPAGPVAGSGARQAIEAALPGIPCSWLDLTDVSSAAGGLTVRLTGVAGRPTAAQGAILDAVKTTKAQLADLNLNDVAPVGEPLCEVLDGLRMARTPGRSRISTPQRKFEIVRQSDGKTAARAVVELAIHDPGSDFALIGIEPTGKTEFLFRSRADFNRIRAGLGADNSVIADMGGDAYRIQIDADHRGWSGMLLLTGKGPFEPRLLAGENAQRGADWPARFQAAAAKGGWKTEMVWYRTVLPGES